MKQCHSIFFKYNANEILKNPVFLFITIVLPFRLREKCVRFINITRNYIISVFINLATFIRDIDI